MELPHLRDLPIPELAPRLRAAGVVPAEPTARALALALFRRGARSWEELDLGRSRSGLVQAAFRFGPRLEVHDVRVASDRTRKLLLRAHDDALVECVWIHTRTGVTLCLSSQAGCALDCSFCATGRLGLRRNLSAGEITESVLLAEREAGGRATDLVFMGQGEPLHNYDAVVTACTNLNHDLGACISRKRISISTAGLVAGIRRFARERRPWRLYLSLHAAIQETRERLMPVARRNPLPELIAAMREYQQRCAVPWVTLQYVAIPGVNMDERHIEALGRELAGLRYILNVIPFNESGTSFRPPSWAEVKGFTDRLRRLGCPVKIRYSAGKREGMGCGQLSAETVALEPTGGHLLAPPGIFTG